MPSPRPPTQLTGIALWLILACVAPGCQHAESLPSGDVAATLVGPTLGDTVFDPATLKGKRALVMFVSPTCEHCLDELPRANAIAKSANAAVVAIFVAGNGDDAVKVVRQTRFTGTVLVDEGGALKKQYDVTAVPYMLVLGPDGVALTAFRGAQDDDVLAAALAPPT
ncbi:MAG TPA: TlpA disulfide reductase family protein [Byssovorax sp.]